MGESRVRTSSSSSLVVHKEETVLVTVPPAPADKLPLIVGGEDKDHIARQRRDKVKEVSLFQFRKCLRMINDKCKDDLSDFKRYVSLCNRILIKFFPITHLNKISFFYIKKNHFYEWMEKFLRLLFYFSYSLMNMLIFWLSRSLFRNKHLFILN